MPVSLFNISKLLVQLLHTHSRVSLPGVGAFIAEHKPASITNDGKTILPPTKTVVFRTNEKWNDGFLEAILSEQDSISADEAKSQLAQFAHEIISVLKEGRSLEFPDFGTMQLNAEGKYIFEKDEEVNLLPAAFGLPELEIKPLANPVVVIPESVVVAPTKETEPYKPIKEEKEKIRREKKSLKKRYYWWIIIIIILAGLAFVARSFYKFNEEQTKIQQKIQNLSVVENTPEQVPVLEEFSETPILENDTITVVEIQ